MPRKFTDQEHAQIEQSLRHAGREIMGRRGVRKTSIDDLTAAAGISKGSFYRFFPGKEALALELLEEWEQRFHDGIEQRFRREKPQGPDQCAAQLAAILLDDLPRTVVVTGMQGLLDPQEIAYLVQRADTDQVRRLDDQDIRLFARLKPLLGTAGLTPREDELVIVAGLRLLFEGGNAALHESAAGSLTPDHYRTAFIALTEGFIRRVFSRTDPGADPGPERGESTHV